MGTCISSSSSSSIHPNIIRGPRTVVNKESSLEPEMSRETDLSVNSAETSTSAQHSEDLSQKAIRKPEDDMVEVDNILNNDIDWISEEKHSDEKQKKVQRKEEEICMDISDDDFSEEEDFLWIPATLASHMGLKSRHIYPVSEDKPPRERIYANDEDLFMSVEVEARPSHLVTPGVNLRPHHRICPDYSQPDKTNSTMTVQNTFVNNNAIDLISLGRN